MRKILLKLAELDSNKVLIAAVICGGLYYMWFFDAGTDIQTKIDGLNTQIKQEEVKKKDTDAVMLEEKRMKDAVSILSDQYQLISKKLPTELSEFDINGAVETYARDAKVRIKSSRPGSPEKMQVVQEVAWEVGLEGRFSEILAFIQNISTTERLTRIKSMVLTSTRDAAMNDGILKFEGVVVGYKLAKEEDIK